MKTLLNPLLGQTRILVREDERVIYLQKGKVAGILATGEHWVMSRGQSLEIENHYLEQKMLQTAYEKAILENLPEEASKELTLFRTASNEVAIIECDQQIYTVMGPDQKLTVWTATGPWNITRIDISETFQVEEQHLRRLLQAQQTHLMEVVRVEEGQVVLVYVDGKLANVNSPGLYGYWTCGRSAKQRVIDMKRQTLTVSSQEVLTADRVTIRLNISADYQVTDPQTAADSVKDFSDALYLALQVAYRKALGTLKLDQILERKGQLDEKAGESVRAEMAEIGLQVFSITLKDIILPGEMRDILNRVVEVEKEAEANVIRRREETNATRSLLNTAKVMEENPVMLRLKELEALDSLANKVDSLTVLNGTQGLMNDLIRLRD